MEIFLILTFIYGAIVGSFLNVLILRLPKNMPITGRSQCFHCGHQLSAFELIPFFSYLWQRGKCRHCHKKFSSRYFIVEFITASLFAFAWYFFQPSGFLAWAELVRVFFLISVFIVIFVIDFEHFLILDAIVFPAIAIIFLFLVAGDIFYSSPFSNLILHIAKALLHSLLAALPFFVLWFFSQGKWMGFGDVKLALLLGAIFGWPQVLVNFMLAIFLGGAISVFLIIFSQKTLKSQIPFGTFLTFSAVITLFYGQKLLSWYLAILGL